jgi:hypothetical protein
MASAVPRQPCTRLPPGVEVVQMATLQSVALLHRPADAQNTCYLEFLATFGKVVAPPLSPVPFGPHALFGPTELVSPPTTMRIVVHCVACAGAIDSCHSNFLRSLFFDLECGHCLCAACVLRVIGISVCPNLALLENTSLARLASTAGVDGGEAAGAARLATGIQFDDVLCQDDPFLESPVLLSLGAGAKLCGFAPYIASTLECAWPPCRKWGTSRCGNCLTPYCSEVCQRAAWTTSHKQTCKAAIRLARDRLASSQAALKDALAVAPAACPCDTCVNRRTA